MSVTVSAIIPTYNRARFLVPAIESVFAQTWPVNELIIVDDGSTDDTAEVIKRFGSSLRYIRQENAGPGAARNRGLREAIGDYVAFLDSDDLWVPTKTALQMEFLRGHPEIDFVFGDMANFTAENENSEPEIKNPNLHEYFASNSTDLKQLYESLIVENTIPTPTVMYRRSCVDRIGFFDHELKIAEDLEYWLRVSLNCRCGFLNAVLAKRRRHEGNLINNWAECSRSHARVLARTLERNPNAAPRAKQLVKSKLANLYYDLGSHYLKKRDFESSYSYLENGVFAPLVRLEADDETVSFVGPEALSAIIRLALGNNDHAASVTVF